uniref:Uncharacterized protein n=1 Tax=Arundo donax TaxID=35708 RepID=A0A0A9HAJ8_ARUDO
MFQSQNVSVCLFPSKKCKCVIKNILDTCIRKTMNVNRILGNITVTIHL